MTGQDFVKVEFKPPIKGDILYDLVKQAADECGYHVTEGGKVVNRLSDVTYTVDYMEESVGKKARQLFELRLSTPVQCSGGVAESDLRFVIDPNAEYGVVGIVYGPMDSNNEKTDSIANGKPTKLDEFVIALHRLYRHRES